MVDSTANVDFGNSFLNMLNGIKLPLHPVSISGKCLTLVCEKYYRFHFIKFRYLISTASKLLSLFSCSIVQGSLSHYTSCTAFCLYGDIWPCPCLWVLLQTVVKRFIFPHPLHFLPYAGHCLCGCLMPQYMQPSTTFFSFGMSLHYLPWPAYLYLSNVKFFHIHEIV